MKLASEKGSHGDHADTDIDVEGPTLSLSVDGVSQAVEDRVKDEAKDEAKDEVEEPRYRDPPDANGVGTFGNGSGSFCSGACGGSARAGSQPGAEEVAPATNPRR